MPESWQAEGIGRFGTKWDEAGGDRRHWDHRRHRTTSEIKSLTAEDAKDAEEKQREDAGEDACAP